MIAILIFIISSTFADFNSDRLKGIIELEKGNFDKAKKIFSSLGSREDIDLLLGITYNNLNDHTNAIKYLKAFSSKNPNNKVYHFYLAESYYKTGNTDEALREFRKSELLNERVEESAFYSGYIYLEKDEYEKAFSFFVKSIDQNGYFKDYAHLYAGITLYKQAQDDYTLLSDALYHFDKVNYYNTKLYNEAKKYSNVINEYVNGGVTRYKRRWDLSASANISYTNNRVIYPIENAPNISLATNKQTFQGLLDFDSTFAPILKKDYSIYLLYDFKTNLGFNPDVFTSNYQYHNFGFGATYQSQVRTWELNFKYYFHYSRLYDSGFGKLMNAHTFELSYERSLSNSLSIKFGIPIELIDASNSNLENSFTGNAYSFYLTIYSFFKNGLSIKARPFMSMFNVDYDEYSSTTYGMDFKTKLPWELIFFKTGLEFSPYYISNSTDSRLAMRYGIELFVPFGIGMSGVVFGKTESNFALNTTSYIVGLGCEYTY